jgi:hypothetical protein
MSTTTIPLFVCRAAPRPVLPLWMAWLANDAMRRAHCLRTIHLPLWSSPSALAGCPDTTAHRRPRGRARCSHAPVRLPSRIAILPSAALLTMCWWRSFASHYLASAGAAMPSRESQRIEATPCRPCATSRRQRAGVRRGRRLPLLWLRRLDALGAEGERSEASACVERTRIASVVSALRALARGDAGRGS